MNEQFDHEHDEVPPGCHPEVPAHSEQLRASRWWVGGYLAPALVVLFTIFWVLMSYWLIGSRSRDWNFGTVPYIPAESAFTSQRPPAGPAPKQVELPRPVHGGSHAKR